MSMKKNEKEGIFYYNFFNQEIFPKIRKMQREIRVKVRLVIISVSITITHY